MESDPGFTEGAAKFSSFINEEYCNKLRCPTTVAFHNLSGENNLTRVSCNPTVKNVFENLQIKLKDELVMDSRSEPAVGKLEYEEFCRKYEDSSGSDQIAVMETSLKENSEKDARKRKFGHRCNGKDNPVSPSAKYSQEAENGNTSNAKRCRSGDSPENAKELNTADTNFTTQNCSDSNPKQEKENSKSTEAPKQDYIHVRARRGQATDSHSLAERVRREKISERMKFLQDLVPGCSKVTGKAVMLDEIINYVQSLQRQVEFLSMKLASVNPRLDINMATLLSKDTCSSLSHMKNPVDISLSASPTFSCSNYPQQAPLRTAVTNNNNVDNQYTVNPSNSYVLPHISLERYCESLPQVGNLWADDLQSIFQMGLAQNSQLAFATQRLNETMPLSDMKLEL